MHACTDMQCSYLHLCFTQWSFSYCIVFCFILVMDGIEFYVDLKSDSIISGHLRNCVHICVYLYNYVSMNTEMYCTIACTYIHMYVHTV